MKIPYIPVLIILSLAATSCVKDVILDAMEEPTVVVECILSDDPVQTLYLTYTKGASREAAPDLPEATAVLTDLTEGKEAGRFARTADGSWTLAYAAIPEHRYRLDVTVPGHEPIWAEQTMPEPAGWTVPRIWDLNLAWDGSTVHEPHQQYGYEQGTFYRIESLPDYLWIYALDYDVTSCELRVAEEIVTDYPYVDLFNLTGSLYEPEVLPVTEWVYGNPCEGWALYPHLIGLSTHRKYLRLLKSKNDEEDYGHEFLISGNFTGDYYNALGGTPRPTQGRLMFASLSPDYDQYLQEAVTRQEMQLSSDLSTIFIFVRDNVFSNITGGLGIFGAISQTPEAWYGIHSPINPEIVWSDSNTAPKPFNPYFPHPYDPFTE